MTQIQALVFDLDDTLYPEREYAWSGFRAVAEKFKEDLDDPEDTIADLQRLFDTEKRPRVFDALLIERFGEAQRELLEKMIQTYREHVPVIAPFADVDAALTRWREVFKLGLVTDGRSYTQWAKIDALNLRARLDHIIVTSDLSPQGEGETAESFGKPHPRAFEEMAAALGVPAGGCVYVADNPGKDFVAPNALGWLTVRIARPEGVYGSVAGAALGEPKYTIHSLDELDPLL